MRYALPLLAVLLMGFAPAPLYLPNLRAAIELKLIQGEWVATTYKMKCQYKDTGEVVDIDLPNMRLSIADGYATFTQSGRLIDRCIVSLDPAKPNKTIDLKSERFPDRHIKGVYMIEGNKLTICDALSGDRTTGFSVERPGHRLLIFNRVKP